MIAPKRQVGFVGIDVDSLHHYYLGNSLQSESQRSIRNIVYECAIPRYLEMLERVGIRGTFFVVGQDAECPAVQARMREIIAGGHEIASHSYSHPHYFLGLSYQEKEKEIGQAEEILQSALGIRIMGFRAPGWGIDEGAIDILEARGYSYDSSIMPSSLLPLLKMAYVLNSRGKIRPDFLLGRCRYAKAPLQAYRPAAEHIEEPGQRRIIELPITVLPLARVPFWATIHLTIGSWAVFRLMYRWLVMHPQSLHYQCHAVDLLDLDRDDVPSSFRSMFGLRRPFAARQRLLGQILARMARDYDLMPACDVASPQV